MTKQLEKINFSWLLSLMGLSKKFFLPVRREPGKNTFFAAVFTCAGLCFTTQGYAQNDGGIEKTECRVIARTTYFPTATPLDDNNASVEVTYSQEPAEIPGTRKIKNVIILSLYEEIPLYVPSDFTADVTVEIKYGDDELTAHTITKELKVNYKKGSGQKYNAQNYFHFGNAEYVKITVTDIEAPAVSGFDPKDMLVLKNEMRVTRYYQLDANAQIQNLSSIEPEEGDDELAVSWDIPQDIGHTHIQLEWAWIESDFMEDYEDENDDPDYNLIFDNNSTRIDLSLSTESYKIPLLYGGPGRLYYRIRAVNIRENSRADGPWSTPQYEAFGGHNQALNWQSSASYAEDGKRKVVVQYFDGSLRSRQTVTKDNSTNTVVTAETFYDGQGRPAIQVLPTPGHSGMNTIAYTPGLNLFKSNATLNLPNDQTTADNPAKFFDLQPINTITGKTPELLTTGGASLYYSSGNPANEDGHNKHIPDAEGYPYTVTRYTPDATGRIMSQSGVGPAMQMGSNHETKYYYGTAAQEELDGLFGTEVGNFTHYFKNMVRDANGQMSVSYVDMHGRTIATALAGNIPASVTGINSSSHYPNQQGEEITRDLLNGNTNVVKGNSVESITTLLVPADNDYEFSYQLTPEALGLNVNTADLCYDCMYDLEIVIRDESGGQEPIVRKFNNININADDDCSTAIQQFTGDPGNPEGTGVSNNVITFTEELLEGSYIIRKTLTISETSLAKYKQEYIAKALAQTEADLITSIYNEMLETATCDDEPPVDPCDACEAATADFEQYRDDYLLNAPGTPLPEIQKNFDEEKLNCQRLCNETSQVIQTKRELMIADMLAYSGQYSKQWEGPEPEGDMYGLYNIDPATNVAGQDRELAEVELLPQHPEYDRLLYAESEPMQEVYNWITTFNNTTTYEYAVTKGYITGLTNADPFYTLAPGYKSSMDSKISNYVQDLPMWQMAYGNALCRTIVDPIEREACYKDESHESPPYASLSAADQDKVWNAFKGLYAAERNAQVNNHIALAHPLAHAQALVDEGYILHFPDSDQQMAEQYSQHSESGTDWNWFPDAPGEGPDLTDFPGATIEDVYTGRCEGYIEQWKQVLLECPALAGHENKEAILTEIIDALKSICVQASNEANPYGASNLPGGVTPNDTYQSFEDAINTIFAANDIERSNVCNPFVIESPKLYSSGRSWTEEYAVVLEKCNCDRLAELKAEAVDAEVDPDNFTAFNAYLLATYDETLTQELYDAMVENCALMGTTVCAVVNTQNECIDRKCDNAGNHFTLAEPQPMPAFLKCGFTERVRCLDCAELSGYITSLKNDFSSIQGTIYVPEPKFTGSALTQKNIDDNILFAQFVNFRTGFHYLWTDYAEKAAEAECDLDEYETNTEATQNVICRNEKPLNDPTDFIVEEGPCDDVMNMAIAKAQHIMKLTRQSLIEDFEKAYRARCMLTAGIEEFSVKYTSAEFHYTLYYYDMAGNLVKTVPPAGVRPDFSEAYLDDVKMDRAAGDPNQRPHELVTQYRYNSLNQVVQQQSPDGGLSKFWYDKLGRLVVSQNAQQAADGKYSYTLYDALGRITEVGQKPQSTAMTQVISQDAEELYDWIMSENQTREQITFTVYDLPYPPGLEPLLTQQNLRGRVSYTATKELATDAQQYAATFYTYDIHGNVDVLLQDYKGIGDMESTGNRFKRISYDYDLISGKVNQVSYQPDYYDAIELEWKTNPDRFFHKYEYDAENRLTAVHTSRDKIVWERDATYQYYKHGPLARTELGKLRVQGIDYAYTLQGWLKGVNSTHVSAYGGNCPEGTVLAEVLNVNDRADYNQPDVYSATQSINFGGGFESGEDDEFETLMDANATVCVPGLGNESIAYTGGDMGRDGDPTDDINSKVARDAFGFALNYYNNDYTAIDPGVQTFATGMHDLPEWDNDGIEAGAQLFNGNIASMLVNIPRLGIAGGGSSGTNPILYGYRYDQLNRIIAMNAYKNDPENSVPNTFSPVVMGDYKERISYDPNGNILTYLRNGTTQGGKPLQMDELTYGYNKDGNDNLINNRLRHVKDAIGNENYAEDIDNQPDDNYDYDAIGNLIKDIKEGIDDIEWNVYGKITKITKANDMEISYTYDAAGNRISKTVAPSSGAVRTTIYVRDATGNVMSVYERETEGAIKQTELHLYGSTRMGMVTEQSEPNAPDSEIEPGFGNAYLSTFTRNEKLFELSNHLGNVLVSVSDRRIMVDDGEGEIEYYEADVVSASDYAPFGSQMPIRKYNQANTKYRYGFNGKENDNEVKGEGNQQDYGMRIYDPRLGRFLSVDPLTDDYPWYTPYSFAGNKPIEAIDLDGTEEYYINQQSRLRDQYELHNRVEKETPRIVEYRKQTILNADVYGNGHIGPRWVVEQNVKKVNWEYNKAVGENIRGGVFGAVGYLASGDEGSFKGAMLDQTATAMIALQKPNVSSSVYNTNRQTTAANKNPNPAKANTRAQQVKTNKQNSLMSEAIVRAKLNKERSPDEIIMEQPRIYIGDGSNKKSYATPDFVIYNTKTNQITKIIDAKDGGGPLTGPQKELNEQGGTFMGSGRYPDAKPQSIRPNMIKVERTNVGVTN